MWYLLRLITTGGCKTSIKAEQVQTSGMRVGTPNNAFKVTYRKPVFENSNLSTEIQFSTVFNFSTGYSTPSCILIVTLILVGFLGIHFEVCLGEWWVHLLPSVQNLFQLCYNFENWYVSTNPYIFSENIPLITKALLILLMSSFIAKNQHFFAKIVLLLKPMV